MTAEPAVKRLDIAFPFPHHSGREAPNSRLIISVPVKPIMDEINAVKINTRNILPIINS